MGRVPGRKAGMRSLPPPCAGQTTRKSAGLGLGPPPWNPLRKGQKYTMKVGEGG